MDEYMYTYIEVNIDSNKEKDEFIIIDEKSVQCFLYASPESIIFDKNREKQENVAAMLTHRQCKLASPYNDHVDSALIESPIDAGVYWKEYEYID